MKKLITVNSFKNFVCETELKDNSVLFYVDGELIAEETLIDVENYVKGSSLINESAENVLIWLFENKLKEL